MRDVRSGCSRWIDVGVEGRVWVAAKFFTGAWTIGRFIGAIITQRRGVYSPESTSVREDGRKACNKRLNPLPPSVSLAVGGSALECIARAAKLTVLGQV